MYYNTYSRLVLRYIPAKNPELVMLCKYNDWGIWFYELKLSVLTQQNRMAIPKQDNTIPEFVEKDIALYKEVI
ncbi:MAG: hypothetical protein ACXAD7_15020 [Candidatus Kariarchaeaceae archaeon]